MRNIYILLFDGFSDWEIAYLTPELHKSEKHQVKYFTTDGTGVSSMGGLRVKPDLSLNDIKADDVSALVLPGGEVWHAGGIEAIDELIAILNANDKTIAAICAATTYLAQRGYLDRIAHTSNDLAYLKNIAPKYAGQDYYKEVRAITDHNIITANGTAPIEFAVEIFKNMELFDAKQNEKWFQLFKNGLWSA